MSGFWTLFRWQLRREGVRLLTLAVSVGGVMALLVGISGSVRPSEVQEVFDKIPAAFRAMLGMEKGAVLTLERWVGMVHGHPFWLVLVLVFPVAAPLRSVAGGIDNGTLEVILAQPVSRRAYYLSVAALTLVGVTAILVCSAIGGVIVGSTLTLEDDFPFALLLRLSLSGWLLALTVGGLCLLFSASGIGRNRPGAWALGVVIGFYFLRFLANMWPAAVWVGNFSIFTYHDPGRVIAEGLELLPVVVLTGTTLACGLAGLLTFRKRQLTF